MYCNYKFIEGFAIMLILENVTYSKIYSKSNTWYGVAIREQYKLAVTERSVALSVVLVSILWQLAKKKYQIPVLI